MHWVIVVKLSVKKLIKFLVLVLIIVCNLNQRFNRSQGFCQEESSLARYMMVERVKNCISRQHRMLEDLDQMNIKTIYKQVLLDISSRDINIFYIRVHINMNFIFSVLCYIHNRLMFDLFQLFNFLCTGNFRILLTKAGN